MTDSRWWRCPISTAIRERKRLTRKRLPGSGREKIFAETGIQFMAINTLYHLIADVEDNPDVLSIADHFLTIADYMNYLFSGVVSAEVSLVSTTQLYNPIAGKWSDDLIQRFSLPGKLFPTYRPFWHAAWPFDATKLVAKLAWKMSRRSRLVRTTPARRLLRCRRNPATIGLT